MKLIVYYDDRYPTHWISREMSDSIKTYFVTNGFEVYNANDLAEWMEESVLRDDCWQSLVLFSQDVVPQTVCHLPFPSSLIRRYLDSGGTVVWIGDIPFYYVGLDPSSTQGKGHKIGDRDLTKQSTFKDTAGKTAMTCGRTACFAMLGAIPVWLNYPVFKVKITGAGKQFGVQTPWYSNRPILIRGSNFRKKKPIALAVSRPRYLMSEEKSILSDEKERKLPLNFMDFVFKFLGVVPAIAAGVTALFSLVAGFGAAVTLWLVATSCFLLIGYVMYWFFWARQTLASAWFINFDQRHPWSGFLRIWDFVPHQITDSMLEELYRLSRARISQMSS